MSCHKNDNLSTTCTSVQSGFSPHGNSSDENDWEDIDSATRHLMSVSKHQPLPEGDDVFDEEPFKDFRHMHELPDGFTQFCSEEEIETGSSVHSLTKAMQIRCKTIPSNPGECMVFPMLLLDIE
ncbi:unnamed protein product, partial [Owenia fusiformis]